MRSRYAAYVLHEIDHLLVTQEPGSRDEVDRDHMATWSEAASWLGLDIHDATGADPDDTEGTVEFTARYEVSGKFQRHRERATFVKLDGIWYFRDGEMVKAKPDVREGPKVGRNDPCPCGSGKKHKKCCGR